MKTGILITARLGSTRLERKHLLPVAGRPILTVLLRRINRAFRQGIAEHIVTMLIATSDEPENRQFEQFSTEGAAVFYGSSGNIPLRHLQAARAHGLEAIVSIDGDDILCSVAGMQAVWELLQKGASYARTAGLPFGMNSMGYTRNFLESSLAERTESLLETGWGRIFDESQAAEIRMPFPIQDDNLRFTLDYEEDYRFFQEIFDSLGERIWDIDDEGLVRHVIERNIHQFNQRIARQYWDNFYKMRDLEEKKAGRTT
jgi:spore coat polysaccharide biosynthesis protein SpsF (cytidylyltransferase family)